jgi:LuxR family transcriptional regulator, glucitol operon activator
MSTIQRLGLYAIIDSIEQDFVSAITTYYEPVTSDILKKDEVLKATEVLERKDQEDLYNLEDHFDLLFGLDLGQKFHILLRHKQYLPEGLIKYYTNLTNSISNLIPVRHAVMHGRPATADQYNFTLSLANDLLSQPNLWENLKKALELIRNNPEQLSTFTNAYIEDDLIDETLHNLPLVDYDDTGFVRREKLEKLLKKRILGRFPVITVQGEAGNGKTALVLQTAYNFTVLTDHNFDAIVWVTAKTNTLTIDEIKRIDTTIIDSLSVFQNVADQFEPGDSDPMERLNTLLSENKILLIIDNLETVLDEYIIDFAENIPGESIVVFTSRIPLGIGSTIKVDGFTEKESLTYFRRLIESYAVSDLQNKDDNKLKKYSKKLYYKPLFIKWFVLAVNAGRNPDVILNHEGDHVDFCFENVLDKLEDYALNVCIALAILPEGQSPNVIQKVTGYSTDEIEQAFFDLNKFSLISRNDKKTYSNSYSVGTLTRKHMQMLSKNKGDFSDEILKKYAKILGLYQSERATGLKNRYSINQFMVRTHDELISSIKLRKAMSAAREDNFETAKSIVTDQLRICPQYFEVRRVSAFINALNNNLSEANTQYEIAIEMTSDQPQLYFWYAGFLMRKMNNYNLALKYLLAALEIDNEEFLIYRELARNSFFIADFHGAQKYLDAAKNYCHSARRGEIILNDLQAQKYTRCAENAFQTDNINHGIEELEKLQKFISNLDPINIDNKFFIHICKSKTTAQFAINNKNGSTNNNKLRDYIQWMEEYELINKGRYEIDSDVSPKSRSNLASGTYMGKLKLSGLQETFGFMQTSDGGEAFIHVQKAGGKWGALKSGIQVEFVVDKGNDGRSRVVKIN